MNKTLKKIVAVILTALMLMSVVVVASAESYVDPETGITVEEVETTAPEENESVHHGGKYDNLYEIFIQFWVELFNFFKYIFYDVLLGKPA